MRRVDAAWVGFWVGFGLLDWHADRHGKSLSHTTRHLFRTHHPVGRAVVTTALFVGVVILEKHINKRPIGG